MKKLVIKKRSPDWLSEIPSVIKKYNITNHNSLKTSPNQVSEKSNEKAVYNNLKDNRAIQAPLFHLGYSIRRGDMKKVSVKEIQQIGPLNFIQ